MARLNLQSTTIENETIEIRDAKAFNSIGPDVVLKNCDLIIAVPSKSLSIEGEIIGGTIQAKRALHGFDWLNARLEGVAFQGRFQNNRFGNFPPMYDDGTIANCDFSNAKLRDALFLNTECTGVTFGTWPMFTIRNTPEFHADVAQRSDSDPIWEYLQSLSDYINDYCDESVTLNFMTIDGEDVCKQNGFDVDTLRQHIASLVGTLQ